jgi:NAD(P)-dependent dehydrogenase (short-subunit alcohol dehydrogenase family)
MAHALVVGGTGMLRGVSERLASRGDSVSVVARTERALFALADDAAGASGRIYPVAVDYRDSARLRQVLSEAVDQRGPITLAVCWIHTDAAEAPRVIAEVVGRTPPDCRYFDLAGSARVRRAAELICNPFGAYPHLLYRLIMLGFVIEQNTSRWLTHDEISRGVIRAIDADAPRSVIGVVEPWSAHP